MDRFVTSGKFNIEPGYERMNKILRSPNFQHKRLLKCKISRSDSVEVDCEDACRIGNASLDLYSIDKRLGQSRVLEWGVVKAIHVIPDFTELAVL